MAKKCVDLTKYTAGTACKKLAQYLEKDGYEVTVWSPKESVENGYGAVWYLISEELPYEGLVWLSMGESMYTEPWTSNGKPEYKIHDAEKYYCEPYYSYMLGFIKQ